jgi:hypothetical protein
MSMQKNLPRAAQAAPEVSSPPGGSEVYELFVAELEARRKRLDQLLRMVTLEANRTVCEAVAVAPRTRCRRSAAPLA